MTQFQSYREKLLTPISEQSPVGERITDDPDLDFIESQMMKIGSLAHAEVQWDQVETKTIGLISEKSKDIKLLTYLLQCLQHQATSEQFTLSIAVTVDFLTFFWESAFPLPGKKGEKHRKKFFNQICGRAAKAAEKLDGDTFNSELKETLQSLVKQLADLAAKYQLDEDAVSDIEIKLRRQLAKVRAPEQEVETVSAAESETEQSADVPQQRRGAAPIPAAKLDVDSSNDRSIKTSLLKVADFLSDLGGEGTGLSIRLRRFAVWFSILSLPDANNDGETQLMPVSSDRVSEYEDQLQRGTDIALWRRVEQSLTVSPYWLDGHYLSARIAIKLGQDDWAQSIRQEVNGFINRLPQLKEYSFKGGTPFVSERTLKWLHEQSSPTQQEPVAQAGSWGDTRNEVMNLAQESGLPAAMEMVNNGLSQSSEPRDTFYWRLLSADIMQANQLEAIAKQQYQTLYSQAKSVSVTDWEPSLLEQLETLVNS